MTVKVKTVNSPDVYSVDIHHNGGLQQNKYPAFAETFIFRQDGYTGLRPPTLGISNPIVNHGYSFTKQNLRLRRNFRATSNSYPQLVIVDDTGYIGSTGYGGVPTETFCTIQPRGSSWVDIFDILYNKALDKLNDDARGDLDLSIDIAESKQTLKMFKVTDSVVDFTRHIFKNKNGLLKAPASLWLQYTYGVKPMLSTIHGLAEESLRMNMNKAKKVRGRASENVDIEWVRVICPDQVALVNTKGKLKASCTVGVDMLTQDFDLARFTSLNPLSIAWELMPYSFVVDWFLNVGGYLRNFETSCLYASRFRSGYRSDLVAGELELSSISTEKFGQETSRTDILHGDFKISNFVRTSLSNYPAPTFPSLKAQLGSSRLISAASLLANLLPNRYERYRRP